MKCMVKDIPTADRVDRLMKAGLSEAEVRDRLIRVIDAYRAREIASRDCWGNWIYGEEEDISHAWSGTEPGSLPKLEPLPAGQGPDGATVPEILIGSN